MCVFICIKVAVIALINTANKPFQQFVLDKSLPPKREEISNSSRPPLDFAKTLDTCPDKLSSIPYSKKTFK